MQLLTTKLLATIVFLTSLIITSASADTIAETIKANPGLSPEKIAETAGASVDDVVTELVAQYRVPISVDRFDEVWAKLTEWESPLFITIVAGSVIEVNSRIASGSYDVGFFNLEDSYPLSGHYQPENMGAIYVIESPSREGGVARQVAFFDEEGNRIFGIFVNRVVETGEHHPETLAKFKEMQTYYQNIATGGE